MIEAMTLEKPLVISRMGGIPEFVEDGVSGWLADPRDPRDFAEKIVRVLRNGHGMNQLGKRAREAIFEKCDDETVWRKTRAMYDGLLE
jgi:glycosyltransferase involved in cell wall biosynthesis